jgi:hypothetical protein
LKYEVEERWMGVNEDGDSLRRGLGAIAAVTIIIIAIAIAIVIT